jgi:hypothetical protein
MNGRWNNRVRRTDDAATERLRDGVSSLGMPRVERRSVDRATIHGTVSARLRRSPKFRGLRLVSKSLI